jgi:uncharacterized oxidoreductase
MRLSGNTVLITGGASGIGFAFAEAFVQEGNTVIICGRRASKLDEARTIHPEIHTRVCDISREMDRKALVDWAAANFPNLNILVNNAGIQRDIDFTHGIDDFLGGENEIRVNLEAPVILSGLFIPHLARNPGAAIINVSSGLGFIPAASMPVYSATKAGMHAFSMALRCQLSTVGIQVFEVVPPPVDTQLNPAGRAARGNYKPDLTPTTFVSAVMKGLESNVLEIGYGMSAGFIHASRAELDNSFNQMNSRMSPTSQNR